MNNEYVLINNKEKKQYEFQVEGHTPRIEYIRVKDEIYLTHTEVPVQLEGRGIGSAIIGAALKDIESQDLRLIPLCPFVVAYLSKHPEWKKLVLRGINLGE